MPLDGRNYQPESPLIGVLVEGRRRVAESWFRLDIGQPIPLGGHCAVFAISKQRGVDKWITPALELVTQMACGAGDCTKLRHWNDEPGRTKEQVLEVYDTTIALATMGELVNAA